MIKLWDVGSREEVSTLRGHRDAVVAVAFSPDGRFLASGSDDHTVKLWDAATSGSTSVLRGHSQLVNSVALSPDGKILASGSWDRIVKLWDVGSGREIASLKGHKDKIWDVTFSPDGKTLASASGLFWGERRGGTGEIKLWDMAAQREVASFKVRTAPVTAVGFSPDGKILASGSLGDVLRLWDVASRRELGPLKGYMGWHTGVAFSPDGKILATAGTNNTVKLYDVASRRELATLRGHERQVESVAFSPDGTTLATTSFDATARLWDVASWRQAGSPKAWRWSPSILKGHTGQLTGVAFSPDGKTLATASFDHTVKLWNLIAREEVATLRGHTALVERVAFSSDGRTLASVGDTTVRLWRAATLQQADLPVPAPVPGVTSSGSDRTVTLQWRSLLQAVGYHLYRGPAGAARAQFVQLSAQPVTGTEFTDHSAGLVNGRPQTYGVAAVFRGARGKVIEGPLVTLEASPVAAPRGFLGSSINEGTHPGSAVIDAITGTINLRGSGEDIWGEVDGCHLMSQPVVGDFRVTVTCLTLPTGTHEWAKAGLMLREALTAGARKVFLFTTPAHGLNLQWRDSPNGATASEEVIPQFALELPRGTPAERRVPSEGGWGIRLRLTRRGDTIMAETSQDGGKSFQSAGEPVTFDSPLAKTLYVGLAITSHDASQISEAKFRGLEIRGR